MYFTTPPVLTKLSLTIATVRRHARHPLIPILTKVAIGPCVVIAPRPEPRFDDRYLAIGCQPEDNVLRTVPLRAKRRSRTPSPKRSTSYDRSIDDNDDFPNAIISEADARPWIDGFRNSILMAGQTKCAISGKRGAWWSNGGMGMVVEAVHIIPQIHWCKFPDPKQNISAPDDLNALRDSWQATWHTSNGLLLYVHIHRLFDARLVSIEPTTKRIRVFMPCDSLTEYQGKFAFLPEGVNLNALQHHYDMCCIENMAAKRPSLPPSLQINKMFQPILAAASQMPSPKGDPSKSQLPLPTRNSKGQDETLKNNSDSPQERTDLPPRPPSSEPGTTVRLWRSGGLLLTNEQEVDQMRQKGWLVYAVDRDEDEDEEDEDEEDEDENVEEEEEEERGRSRKRLRRTIS
ncbi:hypothetical protein GGS24DRAFT_481628 [Hypoxylon argillaceum]|nr:hypothetical protein GGS24DRAFT_481628 [Hypoxylon argillaceum]